MQTKIMKQTKEFEKNYLEHLRHSASHLLAAAVLDLWPNAKNAIGPAVENGFYYDFDFGKTKISEADFPNIEQKMQELVKSWNSIQVKNVTQDQAKKNFADNPYKQELIEEFSQEGKQLTTYTSGNFTDLCRGGHVENPSQMLKYVKLLSVAGAYWRGDEKNTMLTRIYGTAFPTKAGLDYYLWQMEEGKKRDHRKLGQQLDLFVIHEDIGKGLPLLTPKGTIIRNEILKYERELERESGFQEVWTPHIAKSDLYKRTGHWDHYREVMYAPFGIEDETYVLKPMNCPHHYMIYASRPRSYKDLPMRLSEPGTCYRYEKSGELGGLVRVRALTIDDSHILMREDQIDAEFGLCINLILKMFLSFGLKEYWVRLSLNDPADHIKYIADPKTWEKAGKKLEDIVKSHKLKVELATGEASFYGPKIDFMVNDAIGRQWQMSTLQLDLFMAERLNLEYTDVDGTKKHPVILHRGLTGSLERTIGLLIEHYAGAFPVWLSPVQAIVIPISDQQSVYAQKIHQKLRQERFRVDLDARSLSMQKRIREAELQKIPYMLIVGDREAKSGTIALRARGEKDEGTLKLSEFIGRLSKEVTTKQV